MIRSEISKAVKEGMIRIGRDSVFKGMKNGEFETILYASNTPDDIKKELMYYKKHFSINIEKFDGTSKQLGEICGKPFNILILGIIPRSKA